MALALLGLAVVGAQPIAALLRAFRTFARAAWGGQLSLAQAASELLSLVHWLLLILAIPAIASFAAVAAQRAPTLQSSSDSGREGARGRAPHGRVTQAWLTGAKVLVLGGSLIALVYDSLAGWQATYSSSADELLGICRRLLPALLVRAAWVCVLLGGLDLAVQYVARRRRLRMTRQQLQDEQRELIGDPRLMSERRSRAQPPDVPGRLEPQLVAADLAQLGAAALLITGTSCVVALEYSAAHGVPRVWLTAEGNHALELLSRAYSLDMPIVSDELLASALFRAPLRAAIPNEHHARVAQLLVEQGIATTQGAS